MAIREIVTMKDEALLRRISREVTVFDAKLKLLIDDMWDTLYKAQGYGLAAPQIGIIRRIAVIDYEGRKLVLINPKILKAEGTTTDYEGCLSVRAKNLLVDRHKKITVLNHRLDGSAYKFEASNFFARVIQHEMDHFEGVLYIDKGYEEE